MSAVLLDTNVLIHVEKGRADLTELLHDDDEPAIAAITVAELEVGVALATGRRRAARRQLVTDLVGLLPVVAYDRHVAEAHAALLVAVRRAGRPRGAHDLIIAATARASNRTLVTSEKVGIADLPGVAVRAPAG